MIKHVHTYIHTHTYIHYSPNKNTTIFKRNEPSYFTLTLNLCVIFMYYILVHTYILSYIQIYHINHSCIQSSFLQINLNDKNAKKIHTYKLIAYIHTYIDVHSYTYAQLMLTYILIFVFMYRQA